MMLQYVKSIFKSLLNRSQNEKKKTCMIFHISRFSVYNFDMPNEDHFYKSNHSVHLK